MIARDHEPNLRSLGSVRGAVETVLLAPQCWVVHGDADMGYSRYRELTCLNTKRRAANSMAVGLAATFLANPAGH
jgi:hypothetical protein